MQIYFCIPFCKLRTNSKFGIYKIINYICNPKIIVLNMDIVTRLKFYMDSLGIPSSQFADTCRIPRPTLSQLLNGRNKKVSDEIISKVHDAFPDLSIMWLMFGEGDMRASGNIRFSAPQNAQYSPTPSPQIADNQHQSSVADASFFAENFSPNKNNPYPYDQIGTSDSQNIQSSDSDPADREKEVTLRRSADGTKKITSILVFYDDNSFESFAPAN